MILLELLGDPLTHKKITSLTDKLYVSHVNVINLTSSVVLTVRYITVDMLHGHYRSIFTAAN
jgi:hypothetical protein